MNILFRASVFSLAIALSGCFESSLVIVKNEPGNGPSTNSDDPGNNTSQPPPLGPPTLEPPAPPPLSPEVSVTIQNSILLDSGINLTFSAPVQVGRYLVGPDTVLGTEKGPQFIRRLNSNPIRIVSWNYSGMPNGTEIVATFNPEQNVPALTGANPEQWFNNQAAYYSANAAYTMGEDFPQNDYPQALLVGRLMRAHIGTGIYGGDRNPVIDQNKASSLVVLPSSMPVPTRNHLAPPLMGRGDLRRLDFLISDVESLVPQLVSAVPTPTNTPELSTIIDSMCRYRWTLDAHSNISGGQGTVFGIRFFGATPTETGSTSLGPWESYGATYGSERAKIFLKYLFALGNPAEPLELRKKGWLCAFQNFITTAGLAVDISTAIPTNESGGQGGTFWINAALVKTAFRRYTILENRMTAALEPSAKRTTETELFYRSPVTSEALYGAFLPLTISLQDSNDPGFNKSPFARCAVGYGKQSGYPEFYFTYCGSRPGRYYGQNLDTSTQFLDVGGLGAYRVISSGLTATTAAVIMMFPVLKNGNNTAIIEDYVRDYFVKGFHTGLGLVTENDWNALRVELSEAINDHNALPGVTTIQPTDYYLLQHDPAYPNDPYRPALGTVAVSRVEKLISLFKSWQGHFEISGHWSTEGCQLLNAAYGTNRDCD
jgi:hypothetical protein